MTTKIYHGNLTAQTLADAISSRFTDEDLSATYTNSSDQYIVRIASRAHAEAGGKTAISLVLQQLEDGVAVQIGKQDWIGIATSLGISALSVKRNPMNLLGRLDDIAQDIENLTLEDRLWALIDEVAETMNASQRLSEKLRRNKCEYCGTANPVGTPRCIACGAPQGDNQPVTCLKCGFVMTEADTECTNCGAKLK